jgi:outer membrane lipoprotein-sorting protein
MKIGAPIACFALGVMMLVIAGTQPAAAASTPGDTALAKWADAWAKVQTYTVTMTGREVKGNKVQARVYNFYYAAPNHVRMDVVSGAGKGSQAVWTGGDTIYGHKGGILRFFKLHLNLADPSVVSMRGVTIAQATFGALLNMIRGLKTTSTSATTAGATTTFTAIVADPSNDDGITKDVIYLATNGLPTGYDQYEGDVDVNHMAYTDTKVNVPLPASTWNI